MLSTVCLCKGDRSAIMEATRGIESYLYAVHCYDGVLGIWRHDRKGTWREVHLDSGTLAPLLKRLEKQGLVDRIRPETNERKLYISLTKKGEELRWRL